MIKNKILRVLCFVLIACLLTLSLGINVAATSYEEVPYRSYTYWEGYSQKKPTAIKEIYSPKTVIGSALNPEIDFSGSAIGILTVSPAETAIIAADLATKSANVDLSFVDRFSGTLIVTGSLGAGFLGGLLAVIAFAVIMVLVAKKNSAAAK